MKILTFALILRRMTALTKVLLHCERLGGTVTFVSAAEGRANVVVRAPNYAAHRFAPQLRRIVDVLELTELHAISGRGSTKIREAGRLRQPA
ncbi:MAG: hypothetical protein V3W34_18255 [Phycisphaerae bacterium]